MVIHEAGDERPCVRENRLGIGAGGPAVRDDRIRNGARGAKTREQRRGRGIDDARSLTAMHPRENEVRRRV